MGFKALMEKKKILIIGAGIAGLAAASRLVRANFDVKVLEAQKRIGGRICTSHEMGLPIDLGASFFHGTEGNPLVEIAKKLKLTLAPIAFEKKDWGLNHLAIAPETIEQYRLIFNDLLLKAHDFAKAQSQDISLYAALKAVYTPNEQLTPIWFEWFMDSLSLYMGAGVLHLSGRHWNDDEIYLAGHHCVVKESFQPIVEYLAQGIDIQTNQTVQAISYAGSIQVQTQTELYHADHVLLTVPLGILKRQLIQFMPALPDEKQMAIQRLDMAVLNKVVLEFPNRFWAKEAAIITTLNSKQNKIYFFFNYSLYCDKPILIALVGDEFAKQMEKLSDDEIQASALSTLRQLYGNVPHPIAFRVSRWSSDPFSFGSYSYIPVGASSRDYDILAQSIGNKIYFAGEATEKYYPGSTHGAYLSGLREADKIIQQYQN